MSVHFCNGYVRRKIDGILIPYFILRPKRKRSLKTNYLFWESFSYSSDDTAMFVEPLTRQNDFRMRFIKCQYIMAMVTLLHITSSSAYRENCTAWESQPGKACSRLHRAIDAHCMDVCRTAQYRMLTQTHILYLCYGIYSLALDGKFLAFGRMIVRRTPQQQYSCSLLVESLVRERGFMWLLLERQPVFKWSVIARVFFKQQNSAANRTLKDG